MESIGEVSLVIGEGGPNGKVHLKVQFKHFPNAMQLRIKDLLLVFTFTV